MLETLEVFLGLVVLVFVLTKFVIIPWYSNVAEFRRFPEPLDNDDFVPKRSKHSKNVSFCEYAENYEDEECEEVEELEEEVGN